jgi:hypothetical protein
MSEPLNTAPYLVEFIRSFGASLDLRVWVKLVEEECAELEEALESGNRAHILKELCDLIYVITPTVAYGTFFSNMGVLPEDEETTIVTLIEKATVATEKATSMFAADIIQAAFLRVHQSNMTKLGDDGKPIKREDGKIMKGPNYKPPVMDDLAEQVAEEA